MEGIMSTYTEQAEELRSEIYRLGGVVDALPDKSSREAMYFTQQLEQFAARLVDLETMTPAMQRADDEVRQATTAQARAVNAVQDELDQWMTVAKWSGGLGLVGLLVSLAWTPTVWLPIVAAVLLAAGVGAYWHHTRIEQDSEAELVEYREAVEVAREKRAQLEPGKVGSALDPPSQQQASGVDHHDGTARAESDVDEPMALPVGD